MKVNTNQFNICFNDGIKSNDANKITKGIFFAGGGGWSQGVKEIKEIDIKWILNHDHTAIKTSAFHNRDAKVFWSDVYMQDEKEMDPVDIVQASLECDEHTDANPRELKEESSYTMGWEFYRYLKHLNPLVISIENVPGFKKWAPLDENKKKIKERAGEEFERWKKAIIDLGYEYLESIRNAADDGLPTKRTRFFCFFYRPGISIIFPETTHNEFGTNGKKKWVSCRQFIDTKNTGVSIFGRKYNTKLRKGHRKALCENSIKRIVGGIKKQYPDYYNFLCKYHGGANALRSYSLDEPLRTVDTSNRHQLLTVENADFLQDHCQTDNYQSLDKPLRTQLTWQTKQLINLEKLSFIEKYFNSVSSDNNDALQIDNEDDSFLVQYYGGSIQSQNLDEPINTIPCRDIHQLLRLEKMQFLAKYFNAGGRPDTQSESLDKPISAVLGVNKHQLITILDNFDIKARFLTAEELALCSTFPSDYFSKLKLSQKSAIKLIGNAIPPKWAKVLIEPNVKAILAYKHRKIAS